MELGIVINLAVVVFAILGATSSLNRIAKGISRSNELKEKELKAKYPDMDI